MAGSIASSSRRSGAAAPDELPVPFVVGVVGRAGGQLATSLDGRYGPMDAAAFQLAISRLTQSIDLTGVKYVVGIPEGGLVPAYAFGMAVGLPIVLASMWQPDVPGLISFCRDNDPRSASRKYIYGLAPGDRVVVVEDEITSGNTVINCVRALRAAGIECDRVATIYVADDVNLRDRLAAEGLEVHAASSFSRDVGERLRR